MSVFGRTNKDIAKDIGDRLKFLRLKKNYTQNEVAIATGLSIKAVKNAESGKSTIITYIKILREFGVLDSIDNFIPQTDVDPLALAKMKGKARKRASGKNKI